MQIFLRLAGRLCLMLLPLLMCDVSRSQTRAPLTPDVLYSRNKGAVVTILTFDSNKAPLEQGSGFIVARNRIATNYHVVAGSTSASVLFDDGTVVPVNAVISGSAPEDLVLLDVPSGNRSSLSLGNELEAKVGETIYAIGAPRGLSASLSNGLISAFRQDDGHFLIQITATIAPGSSGGPLFDSQGRVIGITTAKLKDGSFGFAVGVGDLQRLIKVPLSVPMQLSELEQKPAAPVKDKSAVSAEENAETALEKSLKPALDLYDKEKYSESAASFSELPGTAQKTFAGQLLRCNLESKLRTKSSDACDNAIKMHPEDPEPYEGKATAFILTNDLANAEATMLKAAESSNAPEINQMLGFIHYMEGKYPQVLKELSEASTDTMELSMLQGAAFHADQFDLYHRIEPRLTSLKPQNGWHFFSEGAVAAKAVKFDEALEKFRKCDQDPDFLDPVCAMSVARVELIQDNRPKAKADIDAAVKRFFFSTAVMEEAVYVDLVIGENDAARRLHDSLLSKNYSVSENTDCLYYYAMNQPASAGPGCESFAAANPNDDSAWTAAGYVALDSGQYQVAEDDFWKARKLFLATPAKHSVADEINLMWGLVLANYSSGNKKDAKATYLTLKVAYPDAVVKAADLKALPFVWSDWTLALINKVIKDYK